MEGADESLNKYHVLIQTSSVKTEKKKNVKNTEAELLQNRRAFSDFSKLYQLQGKNVIVCSLLSIILPEHSLTEPPPKHRNTLCALTE